MNGDVSFIEEYISFLSHWEEARQALEHLVNKVVVEYRDSQELAIISNGNGMFVWTNVAMAECLGYNKYGLMAQSWIALLNPDDVNIRMQAFSILQTRGIEASDNIKMRYRHHDGHYVWIHWLYSSRFMEKMRWETDPQGVVKRKVDTWIFGRGKCLGPERRVETLG